MTNTYSTVKFGDVVRNVNKNEHNPLENGLERYIGLDHLDPESLHIKRWGLIAEGTSFTRKFTNGQVLFGKRRAYQRKVAVAEFDGICSGDILVFEPKNDRLLPELLPFIVQSDRFFEHALRTSAGSLSPRTKWRDLANYEFPLPPLDEQRRIAEILWAADEAMEKYFSLLNATEVARDATTRKLLDFSENTKVVSIEHFESNKGPILKTGPFGSSMKSEYFSDEGIPVFNISALGEATIDEEGLFFLSLDRAKQFKEYTVIDNTFAKIT